MKHLTVQELYEIADRTLSEADDKWATDHLKKCSYCSHQYRMLTNFERTIKNTPLETVSTDFTRNVLKTIGVKESPSFIWKILTNLAPLVLITMVLLIIIGALKLSGVWEHKEIQQSVEQSKTIFTTIATGVDQVSKSMNESLTRLFPFKFATEGMMLTIFLVCFFSAIALMDKYLFAQLVRRKQ